MKLYCGKHPQHYFIAGKCRRCGARSRRLLPRSIRRKAARTAAGVAKLRQDQYLAALDRFSEFCRDRDIPFKSGLVEAMQFFMEKNA
jgi:hypothetical protein